MKKTVATLLLLILCLSLCACGAKEAPAAPATEAAPAEASAEEQTLQATINRIDSYLVLLTEDEQYQVMDLSEGLSLDGLEEGDDVSITYTGELRDEEPYPVIIAIEKLG